ncbi:uncharacterized protein LOC133200352 isoform X2 [Saccostrea echinata]|uniref:uncharacterized protein LOC133200352 isoform X2 n=1 Tax=Saccostrea echinata TaxID=191078 RepID=UPI002A83C8ED|nr:uncharacterized protein LOC133200352 isoform X2 [Saccostrea echinata]
MMSSTSADEADFACEPDPNVIASAKFQQLRLEFLVAVEKIRRETEAAKVRNKQLNQQSRVHIGGQQSCSQPPYTGELQSCHQTPHTEEQRSSQKAATICSGTSGPEQITQNCVIPELDSYTENLLTVPTNLTEIQNKTDGTCASQSTGPDHFQKAHETENAGTAPTSMVGPRVENPVLPLNWRTGGSNFGGQLPAMENQGIPLSLDSKYSFGVSDDVFSTISDLESRPNLTFSRKGRGSRTDSNSTLCKVAKLSSTASVHSDLGEFSGQSLTPPTGEGTSASESDDTTLSTTTNRSQGGKCKRYKRTQEALQSSGLLDVTMKTAELIKRNRQLQKDIRDFKQETVEFLKTVLQNPENSEYAKVIHGKKNCTLDI